ncbi:DUF4132 domain-containing protein [Spirillospora sp. CA-294931]|uniref:DUF4132 domain-containing protein n=1 Tax=Spirillospora sp. CA-294931 TaxID=3240042 RepID=UPI003D903939
MNDQPSAGRDEDELVLPADLRRQLHPRRGGHPGPALRADQRSVAWLRERRDAQWSDAEPLLALVAPGSGWDDAARRYLGGEADPVGAAAVALIPWKVEETVPGYGSPSDWVRRDGVWAHPHGVLDENREDETDWVRSGYGGYGKGSAPEGLLELQNGLAHVWSSEHGPAFAACALVELSTVAATWVAGSKIRFRPGRNLWLGQDAARRLRTLLAAADDREYADAAERLAAHRRTVQQKVVASYLVPTRHDWLDECQEWLDDGPDWRSEWLHIVLATPERLKASNRLAHEEHPLGLLVTLADAAGADALALFAQGLDGDADDTERRRLLKVIGLMPYDAVFPLLLDRRADRDVGAALTAATTRFPARALRRLAEAGATESLAEHVRAHPGLAAAMLPDLPDASRAAVEGVIAAETRVPDAAADDLPGLLVRPPWTRERASSRPVIVPGLEPPGGVSMTWAPGEREAWSVPDLPYGTDLDPATADWEALAKEFRSPWPRAAELLSLGPEKTVRPLLAEWDGEWTIGGARWMRCPVGRFGEDALRPALAAAKASPASSGELLLPYLNAEVAALMAGWLDSSKPARRVAVAWFVRHGADAARMLIPAALGKTGKKRNQAEGALRLLARRTDTARIVAAARGLGPDAASAIETLVTDPLEFLPDPLPDVPRWANPGALPQILLRGRERALPVATAGHVITMLAMSVPDDVYAGVDLVRERCDGRSLAEFSWALFERWERHGAPPRDGWAMDQLAWLGDDETVRGLAAAIEVWPGEGGHQKAVRGLDVLAAFGTDLALMNLHGIAQRVKFKGLRVRAEDKIEEIAATLGLTTEQLVDRTVPDLGLDADGSMALDYGPRRFTVGFDERLAPFVLDEDGRQRKTLPRPGAGDDTDLAPSAYQRFATMKKVARASATDQIRRLEQAMVTGRRWSATEFQELFVAHPLVWHIARRLIWLAESGDVTTAFRVAEDRTFADVRDQPFTLPATATIGIAYPPDLGPDLPAWKETLDDYELLQPFPQVERETYTLSDHERGSDHLTRFEGRTVRTVRVLALRHRGWNRNGHGLSRTLPTGQSVLLDLDPGLPFGSPDDEPEQRITTVHLPTPGTHFGELDPTTTSELIADLTTLTHP